MPIPEFEDIKLPLLKLFQLKKTLTRKEIYAELARVMGMTDADLAETISSGQSKFHNRAGWALTDLKQAGLLVSPARAVYDITPLGLKVLVEKPKMIDRDYLLRFPDFKNFLERSGDFKTKLVSKHAPSAPPANTPDERIDNAAAELNAALVTDLLDAIGAMEPHRFERLVVDLMLKLGYGGARVDAGLVTGKSGDGGIDGVIRQDKLGLDSIYLQAKRWEGTVGSKEIQSFVGALSPHGATKGVFVTTSTYSKEAVAYVAKISTVKVILIDGKRLAELMIENDLGVSPVKSVVLKRVDSDYFAD